MGKNKVTAAALRAHGYTYKLDVLTKLEQKERAEGRKVKNESTGETQTFESRDFDYFFKVVVPGSKKEKKEPVEAQIFYAGKQFYYRGARISNIKQLAKVEEDAKLQAHYAALQSQVVDTKPVVYMPPVRKLETPEQAKGMGYMTLVGGPLDGQAHKYSLPFFMWQYDDKGVTRAARYQRDKEDPTKYNFLSIIG